MIQEQYGDLNNGLLIAIGDEIGYNALDGLVYAEAPTWRDLIDIVNELEVNKADNDFKIIGLDTADEMIKLAQEEVKRLHKKKTGQAAEFNGCFGGYGQPRMKVNELVDDVLARLRKSGYGIIIIGHTKLRDIKEKNGDEYQQLTSNLSADYDGIFSNKADIVMTIAVERDINDDKRVEGNTRYMWFRTDGFVDAGGRFSDMPDKVEYGAKNYINAFESGVKKSIKGKVTNAEINKRKQAEIQERESKATEHIQSIKESNIDPDRNAELMEVVQNKFTDADLTLKKQIKAYMKEHDIPNFKNSDEIPTKCLETIVEMLNEDK